MCAGRIDAAMADAAELCSQACEKYVARRAKPSSIAASCVAKHQRSHPSPSGPNAAPGARPRLASAIRRLARATESVSPAMRKKLHTGRRVGGSGRDPVWQAREAGQKAVALGDHLQPQGLGVGTAVVQRRDTARLDEVRCAGGVVFQKLAEIFCQRGGRDDPAEAPAGHPPGLGEAVGGDDAVLGVGEGQKRRRGHERAVSVGGSEEHPLVDVVGEDPHAQTPAMGQAPPRDPRGSVSSPWGCWGSLISTQSGRRE